MPDSGSQKENIQVSHFTRHTVTWPIEPSQRAEAIQLIHIAVKVEHDIQPFFRRHGMTVRESKYGRLLTRRLIQA